MRFIAALILLSLSAANARALHVASDTDRIAIQKLLTEANAVQADVKNAKLELDALRQELQQRPSDPELEAQVAQAESSVKTFARARDLARDKAIHRTLTAFGLVPSDSSGKPMMPSGTAVTSDFKGQPAHWRVVSEDDDERIALNSKGVRIHYGPVNAPNARARTDADGVTIVYEKAFSSPEYLAYILSHEKDHFVQYTTAGKGDKLSANELEVEAWTKSEVNVARVGLSQTDLAHAVKEAINTRESYEKDVAADKLKQKLSFGIWKPSGIAKASPRTSGETAEIEKRFDDLGEIVALEIGAEREQGREQRKIADRDHDERLRDTIIALVNRSCANPGSVGQDELDALPRPNDPNFLTSNMPNIGCFSAYVDVAHGVGGRGKLNAASLEADSRPVVAAEVRATEPTPQNAPRAAPLNVRSVTRFLSLLPRVRDLAVRSCGAPGRIVIGGQITMDERDIFFLPDLDTPEINRLSRGLGPCEEKLFRTLAEWMQEGRGPNITSEILENTTRSFIPREAPPQTYTPTMREPVEPSEPGCFTEGGIRGCPK